jgi:hypothetical protein
MLKQINANNNEFLVFQAIIRNVLRSTIIESIKN